MCITNTLLSVAQHLLRPLIGHTSLLEVLPIGTAPGHNPIDWKQKELSIRHSLCKGRQHSHADQFGRKGTRDIDNGLNF